MNSTAAFLVASDPSVVSSFRKVPDFDIDRRIFESLAGSLDRPCPLSRTSSGMAGSFKGGLATLLSVSPASASSPFSPLQRSHGSDQYLLSATHSSDFSSLDSSSHRHSFQALSGLSVTPKAAEKSPGRLSMAASSRFLGGTSLSGTLSGSFAHVVSHHGSLPTRHKDKPSPNPAPVIVSSSRFFPFDRSALSQPLSISDFTRRRASSGPLSLQAKPEKPSFQQPPLLRSEGFSLPGSNAYSQSNVLVTVPGSEAETGLLKASPLEAFSSSSDLDGVFLTPACSFNALPDVEPGKPGCRTEGSPGVHLSPFHPELSAISALKLNAGSVSMPVLETANSFGTGMSGLIQKGADLAAKREQVLQLVEVANGLRKAPADADLLAQAQAEFPVFQDQLVKRAFDFAAMCHQGQMRKNGDPVLAHCLETAKILASIGASSTLVAVGLLHDCLDDTPMTSEQLEASFGPAIVEMVKGVSNLGSISQRMRDSEGALSSAEVERMAHAGPAMTETELDRLRTMFLSLEDIRVVLVKLADRLHNLRTLSALPEEKRRRVASETLEVFAPLANRLGIWSWKAEIEDICFRTLWPHEYEDLKVTVEESHGDEAVRRSISRLDVALKGAQVDYSDLHGRSKNMYSIFNKMRSKGKSLEQVFDRRGIRLIVKDERSCYEALAVVRRVWPMERADHFKDYIQSPKGNGYQSLHVVLVDDDGVPLEIQIRTEEMHFTAEYGVAAHWRYKEKRKGIQCSSSRKGAPVFSLAAEEEEEEEESEEDQRLAAQRVEWARMVVSWCAEVDDCKVRLTGSSDNAACSHRHEGSPGSLCSEGGMLFRIEMCRFPEHREGCCFHPDVLFNGPDVRLKWSQAEPTYVLLVENKKVFVKRLEGSATRESFVREYLGRLGCAHLLGQAGLLVNSELVPLSAEGFHMGDQLEVVTDALSLSPLAPALHLPGLDAPFDDDLLFSADGMDAATADGEGLLPGFAFDGDESCPLALEFQRRRLAVAFNASDDGALLETAQALGSHGL